MATIALNGNTFGCALGMGAFENVGTVFSNAKKSSGLLSEVLSSLKTKIELATVAAKIDTSQEQAKKAQECETEKKNALTLAYEKLETFISDVGIIDQHASDKINQRKDEFYNRYYYLKPECEKSNQEKWDDYWAEKWQNFKDFWGGVEGAIASFVKGVVDWCKEHLVAIVTAIAVVCIALVAAIFLGPAAIIAICSAIAFFCGAADLVATLVTGKDVYTLLKESGHPILAELFAGLEWGATIAAVALSFVQLGTQISKIGLKNFLTGGERGFADIMKYHFKNFLNGIKADINSIIGKDLKIGQRLKAVWNIVVLNQSGDFDMKQSILSYQHGRKIIRAGSSSKHLGIDQNGDYIPISQKLENALSANNLPTDKIYTTNYGNSVDFDWEKYGTYVEKADFMNMYSNNKQKIIDNAFDVRPNIWKEAGVVDLSKIRGQTLHELYNVKGGYVYIYQIPTSIHRCLSHNGGVSVVEGIYKDLIAGTLFLEQRQILRRVLFSDMLDSLLQEAADKFYQWTH